MAELVILVLGRNVQHFLQTYKLHIFCYKVLHFLFCTTIFVIFSFKNKLSVFLQSVNTATIATTLGYPEGGTGPSQSKRYAKINLSYFGCWTAWSRLARLWAWTWYGTVDYAEYYFANQSVMSTSKQQAIHKLIGKLSKIKTCI